MNENILVVANGDPPSAALLHRLLSEHDLLVAVDGGLHTCLRYGLEPDLLIGDFDSVSQKIRGQLSKTQQIHTPDQNKCDLEKTLEYLFLERSGATSASNIISVCGALGKRLDHTMTNICLLCRYPGKVKFESDAEWCMALPPSSVLTCRQGQQLSLIPVSTSVPGVVTQGLKWELNGATLNKYFVSTSNVCLGTSVSIAFASGDLVVCLIREEVANEQNCPKRECS